jgi:hypothetical protein
LIASISRAAIIAPSEQSAVDETRCQECGEQNDPNRRSKGEHAERSDEIAAVESWLFAMPRDPE